jgi:2-alkyl-3-oxoalkanoate reductase
MRLALTRGDSVLGRHLTARALAAGHEVVVAVARDDRARVAAPEGARALTLVADREALLRALDGCDAVIDTASRAPELGPDTAFAAADASATRRLLERAADAGVGRLVLASSLAVHRFDGSVDVDVRRRPRDRRELRYARTLTSIEDLVLAGEWLPGVVVRPGLWVIGTGDRAVLGVARALRHGHLPLVGGGAGVLNVADADDVADALILAARHPAAVGRVYAVADPTLLRWCDVLTTLASLVGGRPPRRLLPSAPAHAVATVLQLADDVSLRTEPTLTRYRTALLATGLHVRTDHAERELGWRASVPWREALRRVAVDALARLGAAPRGRT